MNNDLNNVFITGGAGYVGSALVPRLIELGYYVTIYDLFLYYYSFSPNQNLKQIKGDIRNLHDITKAMKGSDVVIHLACISNDPSYNLNPKLGQSINYHGFKTVLQACKNEKIKRIIYASSASVYGVKPVNMDVTEETVPEPITDYSKYKLKGEHLLHNSDLDGTDYVIVRPSTLCGYSPRLRLDLAVNILTMNALINNKITIFGGNQMRPNLNIKDMVRFYELILSLPREDINHQVFNVAYQNNTIYELAEMVKNVIGDESIEFEVTPTNDVRSYHVKSEKIKEKLGFTCKYSIEDSIRTLIDAYNKGLIVDGLNNPLYHNIKRMSGLKII
jgi:nucleoside-diphosphate-sugar epimerase